jgi:hypothetical protein
MSREKHHKKLHRNSTTNENNDKNERSKEQLFSEADAKSVEVSGYTVGHGAPQSDRRMQMDGIPTGVGKLYII